MALTLNLVQENTARVVCESVIIIPCFSWLVEAWKNVCVFVCYTVKKEKESPTLNLAEKNELGGLRASLLLVLAPQDSNAPWSVSRMVPSPPHLTLTTTSSPSSNSVGTHLVGRKK